LDEREQEQEDEDLNVKDVKQQVKRLSNLWSPLLTTATRYHMCATEKMSTAGGTWYRQECEQTLLDAGYKC